MIHQFLNRKQIERRKKITRNVIGFSLVFILSSLGIWGALGGFFNKIGRPIWEAEKTLGSGLYNMNYLVRSKSAISKENHDLIEEISSLRVMMMDYQILKDENIKLKELFGRTENKKNLVLANILAKPDHSPYDTIIIDIGSNAGILEGSSVYADGNILIGNVSEVHDNTSLVSLFTNPGRKTEGFIEGSNASVQLIGRGGGNFEMITPIELSLEKGKTIYLPGNPSLVIAIVEEIISSPTDSFKKVVLSSPVNVQDLKWVQVKIN